MAGHPLKTYVALVLLSLFTTLLARFGPGGAVWVSLFVLVLGGLKGRMILNGYLGLGRSRFWSRGFNAFIVVFLVLVAALYLAGQGSFYSHGGVV